MLERDLQDYLFENPDVLFPERVISRKRREVFIEGRRIDLLFEVDDVQYIVEIKRDVIRREDIGQIIEYYGLMRQSQEASRFRMILVAPRIPAFRRIPLEEFGIQCIEVPHRPESVQERGSLREEVAISKRPESLKEALLAPPVNGIRIEELLPPATPQSVALSHLLLRDGLPTIQKTFAEYEIKPIPARVPQDVLCLPESTEMGRRFVRAGVWWAYRFGHSEEMPKNDVPNLSVNALPWGLDIAVNAELQTSSDVMRQRIRRDLDSFNSLILKHGNLELQAWLKLEHQPIIYHWVPLTRKSKGTWAGRDVLDIHKQSEDKFPELRSHWLAWIKEQRPELSVGQIKQMEKGNRRLNLALRLVRSLQPQDPIWNEPYEKQQALLGEEYRKLKPLIDFFQ